MNSKTHASNATIDRGSYQPAYAQLVTILRTQVASGVFLPGTRLPSEAQLCRQYDVSPMTVRRAINVLLDQGVVSTIQGKGTFVKPIDLNTITFPLEAFQGIFKEKSRTKVQMLEVSIRRVDVKIAAKIAAVEGDRVIHMRRLIIHDERPVLYHVENMFYDPKQPIVENELEITALHGLFACNGDSSFKKGKLKLDAVVLSREQADLLKLAEGAPALRLEHVFYDFKDQPVSFGWFILSANLMAPTTTVGVWD